MDHNQTINFFPEDWQRNRRGDKAKSWCFTTALCLPLLYVLVGTSPDDSVAFAAQIQSDLTYENPIDPDYATVRPGDENYLPLWRAQSHLPWSQCCAKIAELVGEHGYLNSVHYDLNSHALVIRGKTNKVDSISEFMVELELFPGFSKPDPFEVDLQGDEGWYAFALRVNVGSQIHYLVETQ